MVILSGDVVEDALYLEQTKCDGGFEGDRFERNGEVLRRRTTVFSRSRDRIHEANRGSQVYTEERTRDPEFRGDRPQPKWRKIEDDPVGRGVLQKRCDGSLEFIVGHLQVLDLPVGQVGGGLCIFREILDWRQWELDESDEMGKLRRRLEEAVDVSGSGEEGDPVTLAGDELGEL